MVLPSILVSQTYTHMISWFILLFLFFFVLIMHKGSKERKILHMIIRFMYVIVIITGGALYLLMMNSDLSFVYMLKVIAGIAFIALAEITIIRANKSKKYQIPFLLSLAMIFLMMILGYYLPMGMDMFH